MIGFWNSFGDESDLASTLVGDASGIFFSSSLSASSCLSSFLSSGFLNICPPNVKTVVFASLFKGLPNILLANRLTAGDSESSLFSLVANGVNLNPNLFGYVSDSFWSPSNFSPCSLAFELPLRSNRLNFSGGLSSAFASSIFLRASLLFNGLMSTNGAGG